MKVLFSTYPMAFHTPGGGERQLLAYRDHLPDEGVGVTLFDPWNPRFLDHDLVHFFSCVGGSGHFCAFVKELGLPLVISASLWVTEANAGDYPIDEIRSQLGLADAIVTNSDLESDGLAGVMGLPRERFVTVKNGVDPAFFLPVDPALFRRRFGIEGPFALSVGNVEPRKNQHRLVEAMAAFPEFTTVLIGHVRDPSYAAHFLPAEKVIHVGVLPHESVLLRSAYAACALFALPSLLETPGLAALEAAASGAPIAITMEGSTRAYFERGAAYVDPHSIASIRAGIAAALERGRLPAGRSNLYKILPWQVAAHDLAQLYRKLAGER